VDADSIDSIEDRILAQQATYLAACDEYAAPGTGETAEESSERENLVKGMRNKLFRGLLEMSETETDIPEDFKTMTLTNRMLREQKEKFVKFTRRLTGGLLVGLRSSFPCSL
jgi:hypothetical protein